MARGSRLGRHARVLAAGAAIVSSLTICAQANAAPPVTKVTLGNQVVNAGSSLSVTLAIRGHRAQRVRLLLSKSHRPSRGSIALGTKRGRAGQGALHVRVPKQTRPLVAYLLACAPGRRGACRASAQRLAVISRPAPLRAHPVTGGGQQSAAIGSQGGSVAVALPGGASATLSLPAGALAQTTTVTLTPVSSTGRGLPGKLLGGVQMSPPGLALGREATLEFSRAGAAGIAFDAGGANLHLVPLSSGGLPVSRLGGAGVISGSRAHLLAFALKHVAADPLSQLEQLVAAAPRSKRASASRNGGAATPDLATYVQATAFQIEAEGLGDFPSAVPLYQTWQKIAEGLTPIFPGLALQVKANLITDGINQAVSDGNACQASHDLSKRWHLLALASGGAAIDAPTVTQAAQEQLAECLQFDLDIESQIHHDPSSDGQTLDFDYHAAVPLDYDTFQSTDTEFALKGTVPGRYHSASGSATSSSQCVYDGSDQTSTMTMPSTDGGVVTASGLSSTPVAPEDKPSVSVTLNSTATESLHFQKSDPAGDPRCTGSLDETVTLWWSQLQVGSVESGDASYSPDLDSMVVSLDPPNPAEKAAPSVIAEKTITAYSGLGDSGQTTIKLIHDPHHAALAPP